MLFHPLAHIINYILRFAKRSDNWKNGTKFHLYHGDLLNVLQDQARPTTGESFIMKCSSGPLYSHPLNTKIWLEAWPSVEQGVKECVLSDVYRKNGWLITVSNQPSVFFNCTVISRKHNFQLEPYYSIHLMLRLWSSSKYGKQVILSVR